MTPFTRVIIKVFGYTRPIWSWVLAKRLQIWREDKHLKSDLSALGLKKRLWREAISVLPTPASLSIMAWVSSLHSVKVTAQNYWWLKPRSATRAAPHPCTDSSYGRASRQTTCSEQPGLVAGDPAHSRGLKLDDLWGPFQPRPVYDSIQYKGQVMPQQHLYFWGISVCLSMSCGRGVGRNVNWLHPFNDGNE